LSSLSKLATKLQGKKDVVSKLRRKSQRELEKAKSLRRRSASGLASVERKLESAREQLTDVSGILGQKLSQKESIGRLIVAAEERLQREKETQSQTEQEIEFADSQEEKQNAQSRLNSITDSISELTYEIKQRHKMAKKTIDSIDEIQSSKSKISTKIQKQTHAKPSLKKLLVTSQKATDKFTKQVASKTKQEVSTKSNLQKIKVRLEDLAAKKRKANAKKRRLAAKKKAKKTAKKVKGEVAITKGKFGQMEVIS